MKFLTRPVVWLLVWPLAWLVNRWWYVRKRCPVCNEWMVPVYASEMLAGDWLDYWDCPACKRGERQQQREQHIDELAKKWTKP